MKHFTEFKKIFKEHSCCVLIPTYNNEKTVAKVLEEVLEFTDDLIVVNDGSTDSTAEILKQFPTIQIVTFYTNKGKGIALRKGFLHAIGKGYSHAITLDSDGQHFAKDIPVFLNALSKNKNSLVIGARNLTQEGVPGKSNVGNKFSSFWYWIITGIKLVDTQSGFRLYPIGNFDSMNFYTGKFEFEIEVLVRSAWSGINISTEPISVHYGEDRVSHFRPGPDVIRIVLLNILFVFISFLYIRPRNFILNLGKKKFWQELKNSVVGSEETNATKSFSVAFGIFMGIFPIWGFQLLIGIPLALLFRLNIAIFIASANISIPPMNVLLMYLSYMLGGFILGNPTTLLTLDFGLSLSDFMNFMSQFLLGGTVLALLTSLTLGGITHSLLSLFRKNPPKSASVDVN